MYVYYTRAPPKFIGPIGAGVNDVSVSVPVTVPVPAFQLPPDASLTGVQRIKVTGSRLTSVGDERESA